MKIKRRSVLLAFEMFRKQIWIRQPDQEHEVSHSARGEEAGIANDSSISQRNKDIEDILAASPLDGRTSARTYARDMQDRRWSVPKIRVFFSWLWPDSTCQELRQMFRWIAQSRQSEATAVQAARPPPRHRQASALRELIDLFDAIDTQGQGHIPLEAVERFLAGETLTPLEAQRFGASQNGELEPRVAPQGRLSRSLTEHANYVDHIKEPQKFRFLRQTVQERKEWSIVVSAKERRIAGMQRVSATVVSRSEAAKQATVCRILGQRMNQLGEFLDKECRGNFANTEERGEAEASGVLLRTIEIASTPLRGSGQWVKKTAVNHDCESELRLVRLYWRHLLGTAVQHQLRDTDQNCQLELGPDGTIDLVGFMCILGRDQLISLFPQEPPTAELLRKKAYEMTL